MWFGYVYFFGLICDVIIYVKIKIKEKNNKIKKFIKNEFRVDMMKNLIEIENIVFICFIFSFFIF